MIRTVIADDAADLRLIIRLVLSKDSRFEVVGVAADGREALDMVDRFKPDLLVLDLAMPNMDGLEVLDHLQGQRPPDVVVLSGFSNEAMIKRALDLGASGYITKGQDVRELPDLFAQAIAPPTTTLPTNS